MSNYIALMVNTEGIIALVSAVRDKANRFITEQLKKRGITDIATPHGGIFVHLLRNGELSMGEIAQKIDRDKSTVTSLVISPRGSGNILEPLNYLNTLRWGV